MDQKLKAIIKKYSLKETTSIKKGDLVYHPFLKGEKPVAVDYIDGDMVYTKDGKSTKISNVSKAEEQLRETAGFEGKKSTKETNVEEDLRKNYETGKMVPYQSVIAEGKIVGNSKIKLKENDEKSSGISEEYFKNQISEYLDNTIDYASTHDGYTIENEDSAKDLLRKIIWDEITNLQDEIYQLFVEKLEDEDGESDED